MRSIYIVIIILAVASTSAHSAQCIFTIPCGIGSGPLAEITNLNGRDFDWAYMITMYQQNADIGLLALLGSQQASDRSLRILSNKVISERIDMNQDLKSWYRIFANKLMQPADTQRFVGLQRGISMLKGSDFDCAYTSAMICLMQQAMDAAELAMQKTTIPEIDIQANVISRTNFNEIEALKSWQYSGALK